MPQSVRFLLPRDGGDEVVVVGIGIVTDQNLPAFVMDVVPDTTE